MIHKSQARSLLQSFIVLIQNQFNFTVKQIQTVMVLNLLCLTYSLLMESL